MYFAPTIIEVAIKNVLTRSPMEQTVKRNIPATHLWVALCHLVIKHLVPLQGSLLKRQTCSFMSEDEVTRGHWESRRAGSVRLQLIRATGVPEEETWALIFHNTSFSRSLASTNRDTGYCKPRKYSIYRVFCSFFKKKWGGPRWVRSFDSRVGVGAGGRSDLMTSFLGGKNYHGIFKINYGKYGNICVATNYVSLKLRVFLVLCRNDSHNTEKQNEWQLLTPVTSQRVNLQNCEFNPPLHEKQSKWKS